MVALRRGLLVLLAAAVLAPAAEAASSDRVLVAEFENDVNPVTQEYLLDAIEQAEEGGYAAVVIEMDTPGGLGSSMRAIVKGILAAQVPVVVYVAPPGSSADSAGAVIGMSADVLAMAPQTNIGSSTPITTGGEDALHDCAHRRAEPARRVHLEHDRRVTVALSPLDLVQQIVLRHRIYVVLELDDEDAGRSLAGACGKRDEQEGCGCRESDGEAPHDRTWHRAAHPTGRKVAAIAL